ncbi:hypothetical protein [uncultured Nostoc sp.]
MANLIRDDLLRSHINSFVLKATMSPTAETQMLNARSRSQF